MGVVRVTLIFKKFWFTHIFRKDEARRCKFGMLIDANKYQCTRDRLLRMVMCPGSRDLFKFWKIADNISETVQDRDIVEMED